MRVHLDRIKAGKNAPRELLWDHLTRLLVRHLEKQQISKLLDIIWVRQAIIPQDIAILPEATNNVLRVAGFPP